MPPVGGGLLQLVAYGCQDIYLTSSPNITYFKIGSGIDNCIEEVGQCSTRIYNNFEIRNISWINEKGNLSFTEKKYDELCKKYDNMIYLLSADLSTIEFTTIKGNVDIRKNLDKQIIMAKDLRKENEKEKEKRRCGSSKLGKIGSRRYHKRFFYGK
jgi:hypothetical protein